MQGKTVKILAINPGSTSTKIAVYQEQVCVYLKTIRHAHEELNKFPKVVDEFEFRKKLIFKELTEENVHPGDIDFVIGRGGLTYPLESGVYEVNEKMVAHCREGVQGMHASNLGPMLAYFIAMQVPGCKALVADPVVADELEEIARVTGHPKFSRTSVYHALNQKAIARVHARSVHSHYEDMNLIVAHLGSGVSVGAHKSGRVIDVNNAFDGEGPMSPERSGTLPAGQLIDLCFSGNYSREEVRSMVVGEGGYMAHLGTNDARKIDKMRLQGDAKAQFMEEVLGYQVAKSIGEMATVLEGKVHGILITGGMAYVKYLVHLIKKRVEFIAPVTIYPGEDEMSAMAMNALRVAHGEVKPLVYDK